ncbi:GGDEF domain-containing response regulator [Thalassospira lucentensis]|uniref:GGDEF domain-containing response regulator n=1 Tax=Thalassospira lucentensis TaxID=168935 RepID=UPI003D2EF15D
MKAPETGRILIVDDDPIVIRVLASALAHYSTLMFATSGSDALAMISQHDFDVILLDATLPDQSGYDVCKKISSQVEHDGVQVIFVTGRTEIDAETRALSYGAVDFIRKPVSVPVVQARVKTHLALKQRTDQLKLLSRIDGLTGINNRTEFESVLRREWATARRQKSILSLVFFDIDHFKKLNDSLGHQAGDDRLRSVAQLLSSSINRGNDLVARYGGEEFVILLPGAPLEWAQSMTETLISKLYKENLPHPDSPFGRITLSAGVAGSIPEDDNYETLIEQADQALYQAKLKGRNNVVRYVL